VYKVYVVLDCWTVTSSHSVDGTAGRFAWRYQGPDWCWFWEHKDTTKIHHGGKCETYNVATSGTRCFETITFHVRRLRTGDFFWKTVDHLGKVFPGFRANPGTPTAPGLWCHSYKLSSIHHSFLLQWFVWVPIHSQKFEQVFLVDLGTESQHVSISRVLHCPLVLFLVILFVRII
jgi:hypothetical protein